MFEIFGFGFIQEEAYGHKRQSRPLVQHLQTDLIMEVRTDEYHFLGTYDHQRGRFR